MAAIQTALDGINPLNAGKKRDEVISLLQKFFPGMEDFEKRVRKYKHEITQLEKDNNELEKKVEASEKKAEVSENARKGKLVATAQLQADCYNLQRFVDTLPDEIKQQAITQQKSQNYQR
jgi:predicted  nucleic acid-binding Zn-ribbon protein